MESLGSKGFSSPFGRKAEGDDCGFCPVRPALYADQRRAERTCAPGEADYDEDEAFEFIYDAYLSDHPEDEDDDMLAATLLDRYMELQADYWAQSGLSD